MYKHKQYEDYNGIHYKQHLGNYKGQTYLKG